MSRHVVHVTTDGDGAFTYEASMFAMVSGVAVEVGTLGSPDIDVSDSTFGTSVLDLTSASDGVWTPWVFVAGLLRIEVTNATPSSHGRIRFLLET